MFRFKKVCSQYDYDVTASFFLLLCASDDFFFFFRKTLGKVVRPSKSAYFLLLFHLNKSVARANDFLWTTRSVMQTSNCHILVFPNPNWVKFVSVLNSWMSNVQWNKMYMSKKASNSSSLNRSKHCYLLTASDPNSILTQFYWYNPNLIRIGVRICWQIYKP